MGMLLLVGCGPAIEPGGGDGGADGSGDTTATSQASISTTTDPVLDTTAADGSTTEADPCGEVTPSLSGGVIMNLGTTALHLWPADVAGSPDVDLVVATEFGLEVWLGEPGGWAGNGLGSIPSMGETPAFLTDLAVGRFLAPDTLDVLLVDDHDFVELWAGDGSGVFAWNQSASLMGTLSPIGGVQVVDLDDDDRDELVGGFTGNGVVILDFVDGAAEVSVVQTDFSGVDTVHVAPWSATDPSLHLFVGGHGSDPFNLVWAPLDAVDQGWTEVLAPIIHAGRMRVDDLDGDGVPRWITAEYAPGGPARVVAGSLPDPLADLRQVPLDALVFTPHLVRVDHPEGLEFATLEGSTVALVDLECQRAVTVPGPPIEDELFAADLDGDGALDLVGRGGESIVVYRTAG